MNKQQFLEQLKLRLSGFPDKEVNDRLSFYREMIDDRIEDGYSENDAVSEVGNIDDVANQIVSEISLLTITKERVKAKKHLTGFEILFLILGSPIWLSLLISVFAVIISLYVLVWSIIISLWAVFVSLIACSTGAILGGIIIACQGNIISALIMIAMFFVCSGLSVFCFYGCKGVTYAILMLTKKVVIWIKKLFVNKKEADSCK